MTHFTDFPRAPNSFSFAETAIEDIMRTEIRFGPMTLRALRRVFTLDYKRSHVVIALAVYAAIGERKMKVHAMFILRRVIVKAGPGPGRIHLVAHNEFLPKRG